MSSIVFNFRNPGIKLGGFTLAELLIALAILGVIATFTIPKVLQSQQDQQKKAVLKETIAAASAIVYNGVITGEVKGMSNNQFTTYLFEHLNTVKICSSDSSAEGCFSQAAFGGRNATPGAILHNGATIAGLEGDVVDTGWISYYVDWDGVKGNNTHGDDQFWGIICWDNDGTTIDLNQCHEGQVIPHSGDTGQSLTMWPEIFK